jgi:hypothetical protein
VDISGEVALDRPAPRTRASGIVVAFAEGTGWSADAVAGVRPEPSATNEQTAGQQLPQPPKEPAA